VRVFETRRILIWGKTYPELSSRHRETVCTGGCTEDGRPIRLYPVGLRYLAQERQYQLYNWVEVPVRRNTSDPRPESYKVIADRVKIVGKVDTAEGWEARRAVVFADTSWHYDCLQDLKARQRSAYHSLGLVRVGAIQDVWLENRPVSERLKHEKKLRALQERIDLFGVEQRSLEFIPFRVHVRWRCMRQTGPGACPGHTASVLDWGLLELGRREGADKALQKMASLTDLGRYDLRLFMGNFFRRQHIFGIIGLWYPLISKQPPPTFFDVT
jgi:hypothetical protein